MSAVFFRRLLNVGTISAA